MQAKLRNNTDRWAVILAGGDGTRLQPLTRVISGDDRPKQFCSLFGGPTLLERTKHRVAQLLPVEQTLTVVTQTHEAFYKPWQESKARVQLFVQPKNCGTAPAILLSLLRIIQHSPTATVAFFPSDHYIANEPLFMSHVESAFFEAQRHPKMIVLLGVKPDTPETQYGWIEPEISLWQQSPAVFGVRRFWEKPPAIIAPRLMRQGCLWNSFVMTGRAGAFLQLTRRALPELCQSLSEITSVLGTGEEQTALQQVYSTIQPANFSSEVLACWPNYLLVHPVSGVGWCDLGEPGRALSALQRSGLESLPIAGKDENRHRASITYLRDYFEGISLARKFERNEDSGTAIGVQGD